LSQGTPLACGVVAIVRRPGGRLFQGSAASADSSPWSDPSAGDVQLSTICGCFSILMSPFFCSAHCATGKVRYPDPGKLQEATVVAGSRIFCQKCTVLCLVSDLGILCRRQGQGADYGEAAGGQLLAGVPGPLEGASISLSASRSLLCLSTPPFAAFYHERCS